MTDREMLFEGKSFCFTGKLSGLKRAQAEREVRARGGLSSKAVNKHLDYLVVGSIAAPGWKHGSYGLKIEKARALRSSRRCSLQIIMEPLFMDGLALAPPANSGNIDGKVVVVTYKLISRDGEDFDRDTLQATLQRLGNDEACHIRSSAVPMRMWNDLVQEEDRPRLPDEYIVFEFRFVKQIALESPSTELLNTIEEALRPIEGCDGDLRWFERVEGSTDYIRLLRELPPEYIVPGL